MKRCIQKLVIVFFLIYSTTASAIIIDGGPTWTPPGMGTETPSGEAGTAGGLTYTYTGMDLSQTANLYYGIKNDIFKTGYSMDGGDITGTEIFRFSMVSGNSIIYLASTTIETLPGPVQYQEDLRMTLTFSGPGVIVEDPTTQGLSNPNGDVGAVWHLAGDFSVNILMEAKVVQPGDPNFGNWEPANDLFNRLETVGVSQFGTASSVDTGFYYEEAAPGIDIEKDTDGHQADGADDSDVPQIAPGAIVTWTYEVSNTGGIAFSEAEVVVTDSQPGVSPVLLVASDDGDMILSPGESWLYLATDLALDLNDPPAEVTVVPGCQTSRNTYENTGRVDVAAFGIFDEDLSHYCNPSDIDADGILDEADNCILHPNGPLIPDLGGNIQRDTDGDGFGNVCDPDFNNNLVVDPLDFSLLKSVFGSASAPDQDLNGNGVVDPFDFSQLKAFFGQPPGPSGLAP